MLRPACIKFDRGDKSFLTKEKDFILSEVKAVILESTGDMSVLHGNEGIELDPDILKGVKGF
ncbi:hypothetical protein DSM02_64 [Leeuwenhoekiella polynyae]|uniref:Uncharacterized protein n=1 Tax=Leeuwenhoekiella polynyae TaxID=1550906 RepID=A0A4Q0PGT1_9FLAO|nr:hypothetical protein DSM02_64 [Leeuwenhoekiella polynyae]|tara:strand:+ start:446 stop:631 length:186 start_codon:yes stop_codon:yes gene_type:complete